MRNSRKGCTLVVFGLIMAAIVVGITIAAIAVGSKANKMQTEPTTESYEELVSTNTEEATEAFKVDYTSDVPAEIQRFAYLNDLSTDLWNKEMMDLLKRNPETEEFVLNYPYLKDKTYDIDISDCDYRSSVPHFLQWDERWGYAPYGDDNIGIAGCGPTCLSMVYVYLTGDTSMHPKAMAEFSEDYGYCVPSNGSAWSLIHEGGEILGLNVEEVGLDENAIMYELEAGNPIICVMGPGCFTDGGHFIVMTDYVDGMIKINDPNSIIRTEQLWKFDDIEDQINGMWACSYYY